MEQHILLLDQFRFADYLKPTGELKRIWEKTEDEFLKKQIQIEIDCANFSLSMGGIQPIFSTPDESGLSANEYPTLKSFDDQAFNYIINRLLTTPNKRL